MSTIEFNGKTAVITGASQGLGRATTQRLHASGANVVINFFHDEGGVNEANAREFAESLGERASIVAGDVRSLEQMNGLMASATERFGGLDIVVCNAGIIRDRSVKKMSEGEWQDVVDTNLTGVYHATKAAAAALNDGGCIVNLASLSAAIGFFGQANYAAAKAGVIALTKVLSRELARRNIRVNAVAPGVVLTEMGESIPQESRDWMISQIPLGRFGEPSEIADVIAFLASDMASYITGQTIHTNGGWWAP